MTDRDALRQRIEERLSGAKRATAGPWKWDEYRVPTLHGMGGDPDIFAYDVEVIEASHSGECGCRSACTLDLTISSEDAAHIAANDPTTIIASCEADLRVWDRHRPTRHRVYGHTHDDDVCERECNQWTSDYCVRDGQDWPCDDYADLAARHGGES